MFRLEYVKLNEIIELLFCWVIYIFVFLFGWIVKFGVAREVVFYNLFVLLRYNFEK